MSELNREQIVKALEHCIKDVTCEQCPYNPFTCHIQEDALALIKELTEENEAWQKQLISTEEKSGKAYYDLACEVEDLRAENERLRGVGIPDNAVYIRLSDAKTAILKYACEQTVSKYASSEICKAVRNGAEGAMNELDYLTPVSVAPKSDTVREMLQRIYEGKRGKRWKKRFGMRLSMPSQNG